MRVSSAWDGSLPRDRNARQRRDRKRVRIETRIGRFVGRQQGKTGGLLPLEPMLPRIHAKKPPSQRRRVARN
jgi:hypothetical protein